MPSPQRHRLLLALALSLGAHGLLWLLLEARSSAAPPPSATAKPPVRLQFVEVEVGPPPTPAPPPPAEPERPAPPAPTVKAPSRPAPARRAPTQAPPATAEAPPATAEAPPPPAAPEAPAPPEAAPAVADVPRADLPLAEGPRLMPRDLLPTSITLPQAGSGPAAGVAVRVPDPREPPPPEQVVAELVSESMGRGRVERGLVHPYFGALGKSLLSVWDAERAVSAQGLKGFLQQTNQNRQAWLNVWGERAAAFGNSGNPLEQDARTQPLHRPSTGDPNLDARRELRRQMREQFRATRRATLRVVQDSAGRLLSVELVSPSNNAQVDRQALADVRAAAERLPPPPPEALGGKDTLTSLWQFELIISISPPVPSFSLEFDEALRFADLRLPLDRRLYKRVRLLEVH